MIEDSSQCRTLLCPRFHHDCLLREVEEEVLHAECWGQIGDDQGAQAGRDQ